MLSHLPISPSAAGDLFRTTLYFFGQITPEIAFLLCFVVKPRDEQGSILADRRVKA